MAGAGAGAPGDARFCITPAILGAARKAASSKYDYVKVKVWLGENLEHYYILSRYLISRMLTVTKVPPDKVRRAGKEAYGRAQTPRRLESPDQSELDKDPQAVKIALEVKKWLVDNGQLDTSQEALEAVLFASMRARGFGDDYVRRYRVFNTFQQQKRPLIVMLCGAPCTGKSTLAQQLASRLNLPSVLQTDVLHELLRAGLAGEGAGGARPLWLRAELPGELVSEFQRECREMRRALDGDLLKGIQDGKSVIIEGAHIDPGLYLYEFGQGGQGGLLQMIAEGQDADTQHGGPPGASVAAHGDAQSGSAGSHLAYSSTPKRWGRTGSSSGLTWSGTPDAAPRDAGGEALMPSASPGEGCSGGAAHFCSGSSRDVAPALLPHGDPVYVPIVLSVSPEDHAIMAERWLAAQLGDGRAGDAGALSVDEAEAAARVMARLRVLQDYLCGYAAVGVPVVSLDLLSFEATLDRLHDYVMQCIELAMDQEGRRGARAAPLRDAA